MKGWIYFLQFGQEGPIKIGRSYNPVARTQDLDAVSPVELVLLGAFQSRNTLKAERELHDSLRRSHIRGEWFEQGLCWL
jgi:hypothetical protein